MGGTYRQSWDDCTDAVLSILEKTEDIAKAAWKIQSVQVLVKAKFEQKVAGNLMSVGWTDASVGKSLGSGVAVECPCGVVMSSSVSLARKASTSSSPLRPALTGRFVLSGTITGIFFGQEA
jgi:hypothetical protein